MKKTSSLPDDLLIKYDHLGSPHAHTGTNLSCNPEVVFPFRICFFFLRLWDSPKFCAPAQKYVELCANFHVYQLFIKELLCSTTYLLSLHFYEHSAYNHCFTSQHVAVLYITTIDWPYPRQKFVTFLCDESPKFRATWATVSYLSSQSPFIVFFKSSSATTQHEGQGCHDL